MSCPHTFHGLCDECKKPVQVKVSGNLNTLVKTIVRGGRTFQVDRLEDSLGLGKKGGHVYHVFEMNGSEHGESVGGDFGSFDDAKLWIIQEAGVK